ncbi:DUF4442 domain-containing protein [Chitinophaga ginsengisoli]|uniref:Uncharacterized protein DUF4442 n=1 Tax=Chitinophaga ginsengisoli TaxID=363837 RepID=A0A2P8FCW8_9BACT|nr:DUF4442 domain-containing protein [Chitinophaga ginsengisoli]PSL19542.1 uncharacterized protein DUF4442 [Chitinophaga ginsengisoli]
MEHSTSHPAVRSFIRFAGHPFKFSLYLLWKLPSAWLAGVRLKQLNEQQCTTVVPFKWLSQNPFHSTYFACLAMAAEMSTGLMAIMYIRTATPKRVSMLVTGMEASFVKKATGKTWFTCNDGGAIQAAIARTAATGEPEVLTVNSIGRSHDGTVIASFAITWSFKGKA